MSQNDEDDIRFDPPVRANSDNPASPELVLREGKLANLGDSEITFHPPSARHSSLVRDILAPLSDNPHEQAAYSHGLTCLKPALIDPKIVGGYVRDVKPIDYNQEADARAAAPSVHSETIKCSVSGRFIDTSVFNDTNILLEIIQNAEPKDSKGTWFDMEFYADGQWRPVTTEVADFTDQQIEALRIVDNGKGYMPKDMTTLGGGKRHDPESAGRFGSGMKISDRSALGKKMEVTRYSRNWRATPFLESVLTSAGPDQTVSYKVEYLDKIYPGSVVEYHHLTAEVIQALRNIQHAYLPLDSTFQERLLIHTNAGLILQPKSEHGQVMVNGRVYTLTVDTEHPMMFSYDLQNCTIDDQNRHYVDTGKATQNMREIWEKTEDVNLFKKLLEGISGKKMFHELDMPGLQTVPEAFKLAIVEHYKLDNLDRVYVTEEGLPEKDKKALARKGYIAIDPGKSKFIKETLASMGIVSGSEFLESISGTLYINADLEEYKDESFSSTVCRAIFMLRKKAEEHGKTAKIVIVTKSGDNDTLTEVSFDEFKKMQKQKGGLVSAIKIKIPELQLETENRWRNTDWIREFDQFFAACSCVGAEGYVHNKNYELTVIDVKSSYPQILKRNWAKCAPSDLEIEINVQNLSQAEELLNLDKYSLSLSENYTPFEKTVRGDIVSLDGGNLYEQGIKRKGTKTADCCLSYDLPEKCTEEKIKEKVHAILASSRKPEVPMAILERAKKEGKQGKTFMEYGVKINNPETKDLWKQAFEKVFGKKAVLYDLNTTEQTPYYVTKLSDATLEASGIHEVRLDKELAKTLQTCGVKVASKAVEVHKLQEYSPNPLQEAFLQIANIADTAIEQALPPGIDIKKVSPDLRLIETAENIYGDKVRNGQGYLNPTLQNKTIYIFADIVTNQKVNQLLTFILNKKIEVYSDQMDEDDYTAFRSAVIAIAERSLTTIEFMSKIRGMIFNKKAKIAELVVKTVDEINKSRNQAEEKVEIKSEKEEKAKREAKIKSEKEKQAKRESEAKREKEEKAKREWKLPNFRDFIPDIDVKKLARGTAIAVFVIIGGTAAVLGVKAGVTKLSKIDLETPDWLKKAVSELAKEDGGFQRPDIGDNSPIGVSVERTRVGGSPEAAQEYIRQMQARFITEPPLRWGYFMSEKSQTKYNGKAWEHDRNAPDFENQNFSSHERFAHYQVAGGEKNVNIRTRAGSFIDPKSIKLLKPDGSLSEALIAQKLTNGEYDIRILDPNADIVFYQTLSPSKWHDTADRITDSDFEALDRKTYEYYTATPQINLDNVRFQSELYPHLSTLREFVDLLKTMKPIDRVNNIRAVVHKMRYTITERTEKAFTRFHNNDLPQKDFLEFVMNSTELEHPGDGDCDVQNSVFALLARYAGIPSKLDFVITKKGIGHGPASIFLPKIGWILSDTMGDRLITERVSQQDDEIDDREERDTANTEAAARQKLIDNIRRRTEYDARKCYEVEPTE